MKYKLKDELRSNHSCRMDMVIVDVNNGFYHTITDNGSICHYTDKDFKEAKYKLIAKKHRRKE